MFKPYEATPTPVKVYRATDLGAPQLKNESGSLKILLKTCLVNGYGEGANRKEPAGWKITDETANDAIFYSDYTYDIGLKVENVGAVYIKAYMVGGERFITKMTYENDANSIFSYNHNHAMTNWLLVACGRGFILVLPEKSSRKSQILYFGRICGLYEDMGNIVYVNSSLSLGTNWMIGTLGSSGREPRIVRSQWKDGGTAPLDMVTCNILSPFSSTNEEFPDKLYQNTTASAIVLAEKSGVVRGTLPALFWCYHNLNDTVSDMSNVEMEDGQRYIKLNLSQVSAATHCFVLNIQEWVL